LRLREPDRGVPAGKYLVDGSGHIKYLVDPGINGSVAQRDDGQRVQKYKAPKAVLMAFIIDGIMSQKLPWSLVLIGAFISIMLELCGLSSLAFAVGVYLPMSTSTPIMLGGLVRWFAERASKKKVTEAEAESGPGVLFSSGLIAGGSIAGMLVAFASGASEKLMSAADWSAVLPALSGSDLFAFLLFALLAAVLYMVARELWLSQPKPPTPVPPRGAAEAGAPGSHQAPP
jgi:hypothetical protein